MLEEETEYCIDEAADIQQLIEAEQVVVKKLDHQVTIIGKLGHSLSSSCMMAT